MRFALGAILVAALVGVACGGGGEDEPSSGPGSTGGAPAQPAATTPASTGATGPASTGATGPAGGGGSAPTGSAPQAGADIDVCGLLTKAEVEEALGIPVIDPAVVEEPPYITCSYNNVDFPALHRVRVAILVLPNNEQARAVFETLRGTTAVEIDGLGEVAAWYEITAALEVVKGKYDITVSVPPIDGQGAQSIAEELARLVVDRLE